MKIEKMTLMELQAEKRRLTGALIGEDSTYDDARRFKQVCDAIRYIKEIKDWASKLNSGKVSESEISNGVKKLFSD